jgi:hypothetical protein
MNPKQPNGAKAKQHVASEALGWATLLGKDRLMSDSLRACSILVDSAAGICKKRDCTLVS